jgi:hypothetical protein
MADLPYPEIPENTFKRFGLLPKCRAGAGGAQFILPEWVYDLAVWMAWPYNWLIAALASRTPIGYTARDWTLDPALAPGKLPASELEGLRAKLRARTRERLDDVLVWALFDSLPGPRGNELLGNWRGKVVLTGSWLDIAGHLLETPFSWIGVSWGKRYFTPHKGDPLVLIIPDKLIFPVPLWGNVSVREMTIRGGAGAAMVYDHQPWVDHFRVLDDGKASGKPMLLGNWFTREKNGGWFTLEAMPETNEPVSDLFVAASY